MAAGWSDVASSTQQNAPGACFSMLGIVQEAYSRAGIEARGWEQRSREMLVKVKTPTQKTEGGAPTPLTYNVGRSMVYV
jgi:hypothetical protein